MRDLVLRPSRARIRGGHRYRPIASLTQRATLRLSASALPIASSAFSLRSRAELSRPLHPRSAPPAARRLRRRRIGVHPVAQGALVDPEVLGDLRDRAAGLPDQPDRALLESLDRTSCISAIAILL